MYQFQLPAPDARGSTGGLAIPPIVYGIGLSSMLADISSEMVVSVLPIYLFGVLQLSPLLVGFLDGIYQGGAALVRLVAAMLSDGRVGARRVAMWGYGLSALSRLLLASSVFVGLLGAMAAMLLDRVGKGIRTAPRDTLIAQSVPVEGLGRAFGLHRRLDAAGALLGPLMAAALLLLMPMQYELLFLVAAAIAIPGILVFRRATESSAVAAHTEVGLGTGSLWSPMRDAWFTKAMAFVFATSLFSISDGLLYASIQRSVGLPQEHFPLLSVVSATGFLVAALPLGRLADAVGAIKVYLAGNAGLALTYLVWASGGVHSIPAAVAMVLTIGISCAATDGIIVAAAAAALDPAVRARGLALLATSIGAGRFLSSVLFGALWTQFGVTAATMTFAAGLSVAVLVAVGWQMKRELAC